jgi:hypothetical protein
MSQLAKILFVEGLQLFLSDVNEGKRAFLRVIVVIAHVLAVAVVLVLLFSVLHVVRCKMFAKNVTFQIS